MFKIIILYLSLLVLPQVSFAGFFPEDTVSTGDEVHITGGAQGRVIGAGWQVLVGEGFYPQAIFAVGAEVGLMPTEAAGKVYAFGQNVRLGGVYHKPIAVAGQDITLLPNAVLERGYWLSGRRIFLKGTLPAAGKILAQRVVIEGKLIAEPGKVLDIQTKELEVKPSAVLQGDILYRGKAMPQIDAGAIVTGTLEQDSRSFEDELREKLKKVAFIGKLGSKVMLLVWLFIAGLVVSIFMAPKMVASTKRVRQAPFKMMGIGLAYAIFVPLAAVFLLVSVVGMPVGISMMAGYPVAIISGFSIGVLWLGMLLYSKILGRYPYRRHQLLGAYVLAMPLVVAVTQIPYVGALGWLIPLCAGLGALSWLKWQQMQAGKA